MSTVPEKLNRWLWGAKEQYFKQGVGYSAPCLSFIFMQVIRLIMIILLIGVWGLNFYINVKKMVVYLNFWALSFTLLYLLFVFPTSGRQVVERKLLELKKLENSERSKAWKWGLIFHSIAWPITVTSTVLFSLFFYND